MNNEFPKNWYIILTAESREAVKKWWESTFPTDNRRLFDIGSAYGIINNQQIARIDKYIHELYDLGGKEITFEQFKKYILEEETEMYTIKELRDADIQIQVDSEKDVIRLAYETGYEDDWKPHNANYPIYCELTNSSCVPSWTQDKYYLKKSKIITINQIKELSMRDKKIIGYKLVKKEYSKAAVEIENFIHTGYGNILERTFNIQEHLSAINNWKKAGVLDLWFEPVYQAKYELPVLFGYKGVSKIDTIEYGCQIINKKYVQQLYSALAQSDFTNPKFDGINSIQVGTHGIVKLSELKQIVDYIDNE